MVVGRGAGVQVVAEPQALQVLHDDTVVLVSGLLRGEPLRFGLHLNGGAMLVRA